MSDLKEFLMETLEGKIYIKHGYAFKGEHFTNHGEYILLTPGNVHADGGIKLDEPNEKYYKGVFPKEFIFKKGDLVTVMTDLTQEAAILGGAFLIPKENRFLHNQRLGKIQILKPEELNKKYLYYIFNFQFFRGQVRASASGTTVKHTAPERIYKCKIPFPSFITQQRIASILSAYDDLIEVNNQRIKLLAETASELYKEWFVRMRFPGYKKAKFVKGVPEGWEVKSVNDIAEVTSSKRIFLSDYVSEGIPFYRGKEISIKSNNEEVSDILYITKTKFAEIKKRFGVPVNGDILITAVGTIGNIYLVNETDGDFYFKDGNLIWLRKFKSKEFSFYFYYYSISDVFTNSLNSITIGSSQEALTIASLKKIKLFLPTQGLIDKYYQMAEPIKTQINILQQQNTQLRQIRDRLLPRLISGKLEVKQVKE